MIQFKLVCYMMGATKLIIYHQHPLASRSLGFTCGSTSQMQNTFVAGPTSGSTKANMPAKEFLKPATWAESLRNNPTPNFHVERPKVIISSTWSLPQTALR